MTRRSIAGAVRWAPLPPAQRSDSPSRMLARRLDREADVELALGHHILAERLAHRAADLREGAGDASGR